jgi:hypothetical protein
VDAAGLIFNEKELACIAHKTLEIFKRCRLWQQRSPATPENAAAFWGEEFEAVCWVSFLLEPAS